MLLWYFWVLVGVLGLMILTLYFWYELRWIYRKVRRAR